MNRDAVVIAVLAACLALAGCQGLVGSGPADIESTFDDGTDGWAIVGDAQDGSAAPARKPTTRAAPSRSPSDSRRPTDSSTPATS